MKSVKVCFKPSTVSYFIRCMTGKGQFLGRERASHCKIWTHSAAICAKTIEPIEMPFGVWAWMGQRNHVLDGGPAVLRDVAMATTNFRAQFAITGFRWAITLVV